MASLHTTRHSQILTHSTAALRAGDEFIQGIGEIEARGPDPAEASVSALAEVNEITQRAPN